MTTMARIHPLLYQVNTRVLLGERGRRLGRAATLDDLPDALVDEVADRGFDWFWPLGVWRTGPAARAVSRARADWREGFPHRITIARPMDGYVAAFSLESVRLNEPVPGRAFAPRLPDGYEVIEVS